MISAILIFGTSLASVTFLTTPVASAETAGVVTANLALNLDPNLSASYPGSGTTVIDISTAGRNGTFAGSTLPTFNSVSPKSFDFTRVAINNTTSTANKITIESKFLTDDFTIQTWIKTSQVGAGSRHYQTMYIMASECGGGAQDWGFGVNSSGQLAFGVGNSDTTIATTETVNTNVWTNVAASRTKATGAIKLYINGVLKKTGTGNSGTSLTCSADNRTWIGNGQDGAAFSFGGSIGSVLAYTSVLGESDVLTNHNATQETFVPATYTMTYNANNATSGSVPPNGSYTTGGAATPVAANDGLLARDGYTFAGWNSAADGTGTTYAAGSGTYSTGANVTLYAKWTPNTLTVVFNSQDGTVVADGSVAVGASLSAPTAPTRPGYSFAGWSRTSSGSAVSFPYSHGQTANFTLYAKWTARTLAVTFDSQDGTSVADGSVAVGASLSAPTAPTRSGYSFAGWSLTTSGSIVAFPYAHSQTSNFTLYAKWVVSPTTTTTVKAVVTINIQAPGTTVAQGQASVATIAPENTAVVADSAQSTSATLPTQTTTTTTSPAKAKSLVVPETSTTVARLAASTNSVAPPSIAKVATGESALDVGGVRSKVNVTRENNQLVVSAGGLKAVLSGLDEKGATRALDSDGNLRLAGGDVVKINVGGFKPGSDVDVWLFSTPTRLGTAKVGPEGTVTGSFVIPKEVERGAHRIAVTAKLPNGKSATFTLGVSVGEIEKSSTLTRVLIAIPITIAIMFGFILPNRLRRSRSFTA